MLIFQFRHKFFSAVTDRRSIIFSLPYPLYCESVSELKNNVECLFMMTLTFIMILQNKTFNFSFRTIRKLRLYTISEINVKNNAIKNN